MGAIDYAGLESDARLERMDRVAVMYGEITAATREFLRALAESDRHRDWAEEGFGSCAEWLAWRIGVTRNTANEKVRAALALEGLPLISAAMDRGEISFTKVRALTRAGTPENEAELLEFAKSSSAAGLEKLIRGWKRDSRGAEARRERARHARRNFSVFPDEDGMYVVRGLLDPEVGAVLMRAIEAAGDALFAAADASPDPESDQTEPAQRRADAVGLLAERALAAGFGGEGSPAGEAGEPAPISGSRAERYQVMLYVDPATLTETGEPGKSELDDGTRVTAETARRIACDAGRVDVRMGPDGADLGAGRRTRTIPPSIRRALEARDRGCRFPGCGLRFTDAHHIVHWADGGETTLNNLVLLCKRHHRAVHEEGHRVCSDKDGSQVVFFTPSGRAMAGAPSAARLAEDPVADLLSANRQRGIAPDYRSGGQCYHHDRHIPWKIEAAALEALDPSGGIEDLGPD